MGKYAIGLEITQQLEQLASNSSFDEQTRFVVKKHQAARFSRLVNPQ